MLAGASKEVSVHLAVTYFSSAVTSAEAEVSLHCPTTQSGSPVAARLEWSGRLKQLTDQERQIKRPTPCGMGLFIGAPGGDLLWLPRHLPAPAGK